ncbi:hypothetical protein [Streptomyces sp. BE133]|uniref:hypothetical protein n=1 Tax=Streptomyces sp. BE133 TaxID=3002523 RepID=UPI002E77758F|nr:hypothetical protein [Streptomyces sp. BE133]MEE1805384.1 hypothetical protein [Streptomyces sp. BE133]
MEAEDFWLEYVDVDARGESRGGPLEVMWRARFEVAGQVRAFPSYRGQRNFPGWYWAATSAELVGYESWVELSHLMRLDADPEAQRPETERRVAHSPASPRSSSSKPSTWTTGPDQSRSGGPATALWV